MTTGIYFTIYNLILSYVYGSDAVLTGDMELTLTFISTLLSLLVILAPFILVFVVIRTVFSR